MAKVTYEDCKYSLHKWAAYFYVRSGCRFDYWELINSAWAYGSVRKLDTSKRRFISIRVRWDMVAYMRDIDNLRKKGINLRPLMDGQQIPDVKSIESNELQSDILGLVALSRAEKLIIRLYYFDNYTNKEVGKVVGVSGSRISQIRKNLIRRLRRGEARGLLLLLSKNEK